MEVEFLELVQLSIFHLINKVPGILVNFNEESGSQFSDGALDPCRWCPVQATKADSFTVSPSPAASANIDDILSFVRRCIGCRRRWRGRDSVVLAVQLGEGWPGAGLPWQEFDHLCCRWQSRGTSPS